MEWRSGNDSELVLGMRVICAGARIEPWAPQGSWAPARSLHLGALIVTGTAQAQRRHSAGTARHSAGTAQAQPGTARHSPGTAQAQPGTASTAQAHEGMRVGMRRAYVYGVLNIFQNGN